MSMEQGLSMEEILSTEYSKDFDKLRQHMMYMSYFKYGPLKENALNGTTDFLKSLDMRYEAFKKTHNTEYLADIANICMMIWMYPKPFGCNYTPTDSSESPGIHGMSVKEIQEYDKYIE